MRAIPRHVCYAVTLIFWTKSALRLKLKYFQWVSNILLFRDMFNFKEIHKFPYSIELYWNCWHRNTASRVLRRQSFVFHFSVQDVEFHETYQYQGSNIYICWVGMVYFTIPLKETNVSMLFFNQSQINNVTCVTFFASRVLHVRCECWKCAF